MQHRRRMQNFQALLQHVNRRQLEEKAQEARVPQEVPVTHNSER